MMNKLAEELNSTIQKRSPNVFDMLSSKGQVQPIEIGAKCNIQDGVIVHALGGTPVTVGQS